MTGVALGPRVGNLPAEITSFVGRRTELAETRRLVAASRLVTITGVGGVGKTRLALRAATELGPEFDGGAWAVELSSVREPDLLVNAVTAALGAPDRPGGTELDVLAGHLADRRLLLVLDTCEHLVDACAMLAEVLLPAAPGLRILATSREPLDVPGEHVLRVQPLPLPSGGAADPGDAMTLFAERAAAAVQGFAITPENAPLVARLCDRLDGLPLAIELAAVQTRALSVEQIVRQLDDRFRFTRGRRTQIGRHQTLRAAIGWSHELCTPAERLLWARLSVFPGDFDLESAERVCSDDEISAEAVFDLVVRLVEKSVVQMDNRGTGVRYRLLATIREFGAERLDRLGATGTFRRRHRDRFAELAELALGELAGFERSAWSERLAREHSSLRAALDYSFTTPGEAAAGLRMTSAMWALWVPRGLLNEGRLWLDRFLAANPEPSLDRARSLSTAIAVAILQGDRERAGQLLPEGYALAERYDNKHLLTKMEMLRGVLTVGDDPKLGKELLEDAWRRFRETGYMHPVALISLPMLAGTCCLLGELDQAREYAEEGRRIAVEHGDRWTESYALWSLACAQWAAQQPEAAQETGRACLRLKVEIADGVGRAITLDLLAWCAMSLGEHERAARLTGAAARLWDDLGPPMFGWAGLTVVHDQCAGRVERALGEDAYAEAVRAGRALAPDAAIEEALRGVPDETEPPTAAPGADGTDPLSPREREVADLVVEGLSNREIAERLVIAKRTADSHMEHIMAKLGMSSRSQLAAWVIDRRRSRI
ncbi:ATP-binding protein [Spirillospora sp. CA-294931]|uniref:ATP-binding protein n=1 Tax=Spirillospora sp. CA-294931 TaxID=3240042 RepID=UPI003D92D27D